MQTAGQLSGEKDLLRKVAEALDQSAAQAKADMGVVIADLPRVETLARSVGETIRTLGSEARTQAGDLEVGLSRLAQESSAAQDASAIATQRITTQVTQIELTNERTDHQIESQIGRATV